MKKLANVFYEMCLGITSGHMANIPNNPILFSIFSAISENGYQMGKVEFAKTLREFADALEGKS